MYFYNFCKCSRVDFTGNYAHFRNLCKAKHCPDPVLHHCSRGRASSAMSRPQAAVSGYHQAHLKPCYQHQRVFLHFPWFTCPRVLCEQSCGHAVCWSSSLVQMEMNGLVGQGSVSGGLMSQGNSPHSFMSPQSDTRQVAGRYEQR